MSESTRRHRTERRAAERAARRHQQSARRTLAMLTTSALSLIPSLARAQTADNGWSVEYGYSMYSEGQLAASKLSAGSRKRYDISSHELHLQAPLGSRFSLGVDVMHETMTGASPWFVEPDLNGDPVVVMTGASIKDARTDGLLSLTFLGDRARTTFSGGASLEDDYTSINVGFGREKDYNDKNSTLSWGVGYTSDVSNPTPTSFNTNPDKHTKQAGTFSLGLAQVITRESIVQSSITYQYDNGFLSDPYKLISAGGVNRPDRRPDTRSQIAWLTRYRHHFERVNGSLHADYRLYYDTWKVLSHTVELGWYQNLFRIVTIAPSVRYYSQSAAEFYAPFYAPGLPANAFASSDYRLSPYGAVSFKLRAELQLDDVLRTKGVTLGAQWETYMSGKEFALSGIKTENPGLVDFNVLMITLQVGF